MTRLRPLLTVLPILLALLAPLIVPSPLVHAANVSNWQAGEIIDDSIFTNKDSMSVAQIQNFLDNMVGTGGGANHTPGVCDTNGSSPSEYGGGTRAQYGAANGNPAPFTCLKDYYEVPKTQPAAGMPANNYGGKPVPAGAQSAAQLIWIAAQTYNINPEVLLVLIQKESKGPLITDDWPFLAQYQFPLGAHCPDSTGCDPNYEGFSIQVAEAAKLMRYYMDNQNQPWWPYRHTGNFDIAYNPVASCGSGTVNIQTMATAALYTYTPYQPNQAALNNLYGTGDSCSSYGNRNFWVLFTDWFGSTTGTFLLQSPASPAVYLQSGANRYGIPSYDVLRAYGFAGIKVTPVTDNYMNSLTDGGTLGTTFMVDGSGAVYLADNGYRFGFATQQQCSDWGFPTCLSSGTTKSITPGIFSFILNGGDIKSLMLNGTAIYLMQGGNKRPFLSYQALLQNGYSASDITPITNSLNSGQPIGYSLPENNSFVKFGTNPIIYVYSGGNFYALNSYDVFRSLLPPNSNVTNDTASQYTTSAPTATTAIPSTITIQGGAREYLLTGGYKYDITGVSSDWPTATALDALSSVLSAKPTQAVADSNSTYRLSTGLLFRVQGNSVVPFYSLSDFFKSPFTKTPIAIGDATSGMPSTAPYITPGAGTVYQTTDATKQQMIFIRNLDGSSCSLVTTDQLGAFRLDTSNVYRINESAPTGPALVSLVQAQDGSQYIVYRTTKIPVSSLTLSDWGIGSFARCSLTLNFLGLLPTSQGNKTFAFARLANGTIYYAQNGAGHQVMTYNKFLSLGGSVNNTVDVPDDFLGYITLGSPIN